MKIKKIFFIAIAVIFFTVLYNGIGIIREYGRSVSKDGKTITVTVPKGASEKTISEILKKNGVIKYKTSFRLKMKNSPNRGKLNYGTFELHKGMCLDDVIATLLKSVEMEKGIVVTIPEGYSVEQIAVKCEESGLVTKEAFLDELENGKFEYDFINDIPNPNGIKHRLQGYLFPNTYTFKKDATAHQIIDEMLKQFEKEYMSAKTQNKSSMEMNDIIIIASLIEKEAKLPQEREVISGVIQNRMKKGMMLQIDASVVYAITDGMYDANRVLYKDLKTESPYNLYMVEGLPVGAICNPGIESILAAMNPKLHNYLYYHTDTEKNDGSHIFTETFSEHKK